MDCHAALRCWTLLACVVIALPVVAQDDSADEDKPGLYERFKDHVWVSGTLTAETAIDTGDGDFQKFEIELQPEFEFALPHEMDLTIIPRFRVDTLDKLEPGAPGQHETSGISRRLFIGDIADFELREAYLETTVGDTYLTIGKQQVVWGKADGLKVLDVVNPTDFREFIMEDFDQSRIPLWTVNAEIPIKDLTLQLLWIPDQTYHNIPESGALYEFTGATPTIPPGVTVVQNNFDRPNDVIGDSDFGARLSAFLGGWDLTLNYFYHYDDIPVIYRTITLPGGGPLVTVNPGYERSHLMGGTFSNAFGDLTLRGEFGYSTDKFYSTSNLADVDGVHRTGEFAYVIGLDWFGISETILSFQLFQSYITNDAPGLSRDPTETSVTLLVQRDFINDSLIISTIFLHNFNDGDGMVRPKVAYEMRSNLNVWAGLDLFYGPPGGFFGEFDHHDRMVLGMELGF